MGWVVDTGQSCVAVFVLNLPPRMRWRGERFGFVRFANFTDARRATLRLNGSIYLDIEYGSTLHASKALEVSKDSLDTSGTLGGEKAINKNCFMEEVATGKRERESIPIDGVIEEEKLSKLQFVLWDGVEIYVL
ncbi:hypothetical protein Golob_004909 [Gossypium lobatum]|uniref:RRM domain-containing protein n=1 Tax=Gossypium lobatum TaxID=34289 RepID=A0A7J8N3C7_9ROSI|nr:hypothetical protein [Gossypium lobatum]